MLGRAAFLHHDRGAFDVSVPGCKEHGLPSRQQLRPPVAAAGIDLPGRQSALLRVADRELLQPGRPPAVTILEGVSQSTEGAYQYSISDSGSLAYAAGATPELARSLAWVDRRVENNRWTCRRASI
jgi:hypothetical protein